MLKREKSALCLIKEECVLKRDEKEGDFEFVLDDVQHNKDLKNQARSSSSWKERANFSWIRSGLKRSFKALPQSALRRFFHRFSAGREKETTPSSPKTHRASFLSIFRRTRLHPSDTRSANSDSTKFKYKYYLPADFYKILNSSYYWGKMDKYQAAELLSDKPDGTFILRDSVQSGYVFSVSFTRFQVVKHARIEHLNGEFSFDFCDPEHHRAKSVHELINYYSNPDTSKIFYPKLFYPLPKIAPFQLKELCRGKICEMYGGDFDKVATLDMPQGVRDFVLHYQFRYRVYPCGKTELEPDFAPYPNMSRKLRT